MRVVGFVLVGMAASLVSACALFQPVKEQNAINDADTCIVTEARVAAPAPTALEAAVGTALSRCDVEIRASESRLLANTLNDGRPASLKLGELHRSQRELARHIVSLERAS